MKGNIRSLLQSVTTFRVLLALSILSSAITFIYGHITGFSDEGHYWSLAEGMHHGSFSAWYFLPVHVPETLRTWGYPFFLYLCQFISKSYWCPQIIQFILFLITIAMVIRLIRHYSSGYTAVNIFLFFLIFNNHIGFYAGVLIAENLTVFFTTLFVYIYILRRDTFLKFIVLAILCFILFQLRPIFMLFPAMLFFYILIFRRTLIKYAFVYTLVFAVTLIPFGLWNKSNHGVFKITPLEGGYGVALQGGYWDYRLPVGFTAPYYWGIAIDDDLLQPEFMPKNEKPLWARRYIHDWQQMEAELDKGDVTRADSMLKAYESDPAYKSKRNFYIYTTRYTVEREKMLKEKFINYVKEDPSFYVKTRVYVFFRQWVTGINKKELLAANGIKGYFKVLYPFLVTFIFILCGLFFILYNLIRRNISIKQFHIFFLFIAYIAVVDIPFGVVSRYTVPVHLFVLMLTALILATKITKGYKQ